MSIESNPRPNHKMTRCCGNCKFFLSSTSENKYGRCILPDGPKMAQNPNKELKGRMDEFAPTYAQCYCDNHQWKPKGYLRRAIKYAGVSANEVG